MKATLLSLFAVVSLTALGSCSNLGQVSPWEKNHLPAEMTFGDPLDERLCNTSTAARKTPVAATASVVVDAVATEDARHEQEIQNEAIG